MSLRRRIIALDARLDGSAGRIGPPLALMALIFALSAQPNLNSGLGVIDLVGRKLVHATEYGLLWLLWHRALRWRRPALAALVAGAYAVTDEYHQHFVTGRVGSPVDWGHRRVGHRDRMAAMAAVRTPARQRRARGHRTLVAVRSR